MERRPENGMRMNARTGGVFASAMCLTALLIQCGGALWWVCWALSAVPVWALLRKPEHASAKGASLPEMAVSAALACAYLTYFVFLAEHRIGGIAARGGVLAVLCGVLGAYALWLAVMKTLRAALHALEAPLRMLCARPWIWVFLLAALCVVAADCLTTLFYRPTQMGNLMLADRLFTTDTGEIVASDAWRNLAAEENDFRQPLFALFAMPVSIPIFVLSKLLAFAPDFYVFAMAVAQLFLLFLALAMLACLTGWEGAERNGFFLTLLISYPTLLFALNMEQYIFAVFWMIAFLYASLQKRGGRKLLYIAATGSLLTTGVWFPLIAQPKPRKNWMREIAMAALLTVYLLTACGRLELLEVFDRQVGRYAGYIEAPLTFGDKLLQYLNFIGTCLVAPQTVISDPNGQYQLAEAVRVNGVGVALLALAVIGAARFWQKPLMRACAGWMGFSFVLLCVFGWGTAENGLVLYTLYFGWAFLTPAFAAVYEALHGLGKGRAWALAAVALAVLCMNGLSLLELLRFARRCYPR